MECENEFKQLYNSGFKLINLNQKGLDQYFRIRSKLRCTYERLLIEEAEFSSINEFEVKLWEECYDKPVKWIENELETTVKSKTKMTINRIHLRRLRSVLVSLLDEGSAFFQSLLRSDKIVTKFRYKISIYASILLRKRENSSSALKSFRAFNLLQDAITFEPFKGFGFLVLAKWTLEDGDELLSMYWALISLNVLEREEKAVEFLKTFSRNLATSPSFTSFKGDDEVIISQLLQMATHALLSQLSGTSHLKHLDQLSHFQLRNLDKFSKFKSLKYLITSLWMILGTFNEQEQVSQVQTCILAKLFQVHDAFITESSITRVLLAFASNEKYSRLFTGNNYKTMMKINVFSYETLNNLLKKLLEIDTQLNEQVYYDFIYLNSSFSTDSHGSSCLIDYFIEKGLYYRKGDKIEFISTYEKIKKTERSMKLLTHRFLSTQLESIEAKIEPTHLPWTIPDYPTLLKQFSRIRKLILSREIRVLITLSLLQELDLDKSHHREIRDIIRFLHERIDSNDPCIKLENGKPEFHAIDMNPYSDYRQKLKMSHLRSVKLFVNNENSNVKIICSDSNFKDYLISGSGNISKDLIFNEI